MSKRLAIIILNHRTADLTIDCVSSLAGEVEIGRDVVIIVDNASGDGSAERIEKALLKRGWHDWARVLRAPTNGGFAAGNNLGIAAVDAEAYLLLNSDTVVRRGAIAKLREAMRVRPDAGLIGPSMEGRDGLRTVSCFRNIHPLTEFLNAARTGLLTRALRRYEASIAPSNVPTDSDWIGFACVLVRREVIEQVGPLDTGFFMYFEDVDYCRRAREAGWAVVYWPDARIVHYEGSTSGVKADTRAHDRKPRYFYESRSRYFRKYYGTSGLWFANTLWTLGRAVSLLREIVNAKRRHTSGREARDIWAGCWRPAVREEPPDTLLGSGT